MIITEGARISESAYVETVEHGWTAQAGSTVRPAERHWHMVVVKTAGVVQLLVVGPLTSSGVVSWGEGGEILWIKLKLGTFMPHLPPKHYLDVEAALPGASHRAFWLKGSAWEFPNFENVETFIDRLVREEILVRDPVVNAVLQGERPDLSSRTVRHRFQQATGLTQNHIYQIERAQQAATLLQQGKSILDTVDELGYFDQPHLTRALKQWVGYTPLQIIRMSKPDCHFVQDIVPTPAYDTNVLSRVR
jgi:hypothetical protein